MKTRELFIEDAPEEFYARASDDQGTGRLKWINKAKFFPLLIAFIVCCSGNEFSSVDGLVFRWTFEGHSADDQANEHVLRWVKFADSSYDVIPSIAALESQGLQGHVVLIEGLRTGSARVSVQLESDSFKVSLSLSSYPNNLLPGISGIMGKFLEFCVWSQFSLNIPCLAKYFSTCFTNIW